MGHHALSLYVGEIVSFFGGNMKNHLFQKSLFIAVIAIGVGVGISVWAQQQEPSCESECADNPFNKLDCKLGILRTSKRLTELASSANNTPNPSEFSIFTKKHKAVQNDFTICCDRYSNLAKESLHECGPAPFYTHYSKIKSKITDPDPSIAASKPSSAPSTAPAAQATANSTVTAQQQTLEQALKEDLSKATTAQQRAAITKHYEARLKELSDQQATSWAGKNKDDSKMSSWSRDKSHDALLDRRDAIKDDLREKRFPKLAKGAGKGEGSNYSTSDGKAPTTKKGTREALRESRKDIKESKKNAREAEKEHRRDRENATAENDIIHDDRKSWEGGEYNTTKRETTEMMNMAFEGVKGTTKGVMTGIQQGQAGQQQAQMSRSGMNFSNKDAVEMQKSALKQAAKGANAVGAINMVIGAAQMYQMGKHKKSATDVSNTARRANTSLETTYQKQEVFKGISVDVRDPVKAEADVKTEFEKCLPTAPLPPPPFCSGDTQTDAKNLNAAVAKIDALSSEYVKYKANVANNEVGQKKVQKQLALQQGVTAIGTVTEGTMNLMQAAMYKKQANNLMPFEGGPGGNFNGNFNPRGNDNDSPDQISTPEALTDNSIEQNKDEEKLELGDDANFNPDMFNNDVAGGPAANPFQDKPLDAGGGAGGVGGGGAGGTSAAQDAATADNGPKGKSAGGGNYGKDDGAGSRFGRMGGGSGGSASPDMNFADLLKQFLPKDEKAEDLAATEPAEDRSPASDSAAVMSREKNIFKEISKRYGKKHAEGAVLFQ